MLYHLDVTVDVLSPIACLGVPRIVVRVSVGAELNGEHKRQSIYTGLGPGP
jgi:hypothetical protein